MLLDPQHCNPYSSGRLVVLFCGSGRRANSPEPFLLAVGTSGRGRSSEQIAHIIRSVGKHYTRISEMSRCLLAMGNPGPHRAKLTVHARTIPIRIIWPDRGINNSVPDLDGYGTSVRNVPVPTEARGVHKDLSKVFFKVC